MSMSTWRAVSGWISSRSRPLSAAPMAALRAVAAQQRDAWFSPADPRVLALCRVLIFWHVWPGFRVRDVAAFADFRTSAWYPVSFFEVLSLSLPDAPVLHALSFGASVAAFCPLIGLCYPLAAGASALLELYLRGVPQNFGKINHSENLLIFALFVFAFARAADVWSADALIGRAFGRAPRPVVASDRYRWPVRFLTLLVVTMYAAAGASKLINSGWDWAFSSSFRWLLLRHHFTHHPPTRLGVWIADYPALCQALAFSALCIELAAPLALFGKWPHRVFIFSLFMLQVNIWLLLGVRFSAMLPLFACLLPWHQALVAGDACWRWVRARAALVRPIHRSDG